MPTPPPTAARFAALCLLAAAVAAADPVPVRTDRWTMAPTHGFPAQGVGWETLVYARAIHRHLFQGNYHCGGSEPNQAMLAYDFASNRWDVLDMTGSFHGENMPEAGHPSIGFAYDPNHATVVWLGDSSGSNQAEAPYHTWSFDVLGLTGRDEQPPHHPPSRQAGGAFAAAAGKLVIEGGESFIGTWEYDVDANDWSRVPDQATGAPDPSLIQPAMAYDDADRCVYLFGGTSAASGYPSDLYRFDVAAGTWSAVATADGVKPPGRVRHAIAYDSTNDVLLLHGGLGANDAAYADTWVFDLAAHRWTELALLDAPPAEASWSQFGRMSYDSDHNAFVLVAGGGGGYADGPSAAYAIQTWLFRYRGTGPDAGTESPTFAPTPGGLNRHADAWAKEPVLAGDGASVDAAWTETGEPFDTGDATYSHRVYVDRFADGAWSAVGDGSPSAVGYAESGDPSLAIVAGAPWASWYAFGSSVSVVAKRWDGGAWVGGPIGLVDDEAAVFQGRSQLADVAGAPCIGVIENAKPLNRAGLFVKRWDGAAWNLLGACLNRDQQPGTNAESVAIASDGAAPVVAWTEDGHPANPQVYVARWDGAAWVALGGSLDDDPANGWASDATICCLGAQPFVAFTERTQAGDAHLRVKTWSGGAWIAVGGGAPDGAAVGWSFRPKLRADAATGSVYVAWAQQPALGVVSQACVGCWRAGAWTRLGGSLNADPAAGRAQRMDIALVGGDPVAAWGEVKLGSLRQIYAKRWRDGAWTSLDGGAAGGGTTGDGTTTGSTGGTTTDGTTTGGTTTGSTGDTTTAGSGAGGGGASGGSGHRGCGAGAGAASTLGVALALGLRRRRS